MTTQVKEKLLTVATTGVYVDFTPQQIQSYTREVVLFLKNHRDSVDNVEFFELLELQFWLDIFTSRDVDAKLVLDKLADQFSSVGHSQRIKLLQLVYYEAQGNEEQARNALGTDTDELILTRRQTTFYRNDPEKYIFALNTYLDKCGLDLVAWSELASQYHQVGHYDKAVYCYQEILLQEPKAYPFFYRVGLNYYFLYLQQEKTAKPAELVGWLQNSLNNFCRSVELSPSYDKGWEGIERLVELGVPAKTKSEGRDYGSQLLKLESVVKRA